MAQVRTHLSILQNLIWCLTPANPQPREALGERHKPTFDPHRLPQTRSAPRQGGYSFGAGLFSEFLCRHCSKKPLEAAGIGEEKHYQLGCFSSVSETESSRNNSSRKNCLREINDLFKKKQRSQSLRESLLYYAVSQEVKKKYDFNQMIMTLVANRPGGSKLSECLKYLRLPIIHQR